MQYLLKLFSLVALIFTSVIHSLPADPISTFTSSNGTSTFRISPANPELKSTTDSTLFNPNPVSNPSGPTTQNLGFHCRVNGEVSPLISDVDIAVEMLNRPHGWPCPQRGNILINQCETLAYWRTAVIVICGSGGDYCRDIRSWLRSTFVTSDWCQRNGRTEGSIAGFGYRKYYKQLTVHIYRAW